MNINYEYYKIFYYVAKYQSVSKASEKMNMNQPNVSRVLKKLENDLGCLLFVRSNKGVILNDRGQLLFEKISKAVELIEMGESEVLDNKTLEKGKLCIGISEISIRMHLMPILVEFREKHPNVDLSLRLFNSNTLTVNALKNGNIDLAIVSAQEELPSNIKEYKLIESSFICVCGNKYTELINRPIHLSELSKYSFISLARGTSFYRDLKKYYDDNNVPLRVDIEIASFDQVNNLILDNMGVAIVPEGFADPRLFNMVKIVNLIEPLPVNYTCYLKRDDISQPRYYYDLEKMIMDYKKYSPSKVVLK